ncbi:DUF1631 family protein [Chitinivorax sp. B]|uniref:DUF1631 family protein n=1 Tax=Chitinivorax sp. B TaxID=2502235 RepID=UPI001485663F|nr:DUF1631 family protein [Chitinivorax sp. B]
MDRNDLLAATRAEFMHAFVDPLEALLQRCSEHLFQKADAHPSPVERRKLMDARDILSRQTSLLKQNLKSSMEHLINRSFQTAYSTFRPSFSSMQINSLSLVETSTVDDEIRIETITKLLRNEAEEQLRDLNIRIALLFEQDNIKERENPFRPYLFSRCIATATEQLALPPEIAAVLIVQLAEEFGSRIADIYGALNSLLARHGIAAELQLKIRRPVSSGSSSSTAATPAAHETQATTDYAPLPAGGPANTGATHLPSNEDLLMQWVQQQSAQWGTSGRNTEHPAPPATTSPATTRGSWLQTTQQVGHVLRKLFVSSDNVSGLRASPISQPLEQSLQQLTSEALSEHDSWQQEDGSIRNVMMEQRPALRDATSDINQQMIIDVVAMLFEFILRDSQVPAEVRAQLGRLQILVLKHALQDPALFNQKNHPARMLVNRIGSISLGLKHMDPSGERVTTEIVRIVESLLADDHEGLALFERMLDELDAFIARELRSGDAKVERAVQVMENAASRTLRYARISASMADALSNLTIDNDLKDFLINHWPRVIEKAERETPTKADRFRLMVPDLIWSIAPKTTEQDRRQLVVLLQPMLATLREGLKWLDWPPDRQQSLLGWLVDSHTHALRAGQVQAQVPSLSHIHDQFMPLINPLPVDIPEDIPVEINRHVLDDTLTELESELTVIDHQYQQLMHEVTAVDAALTSSSITKQNDTPDEELHQLLQSGVMIEINLDGHPSRARLNWISQHATNLVLSMDGRSEPAIISLRLFKRLLQNGRAKFLEAAPLFERAVQSLLQTADGLVNSNRPTHPSPTNM